MQKMMVCVSLAGPFFVLVALIHFAMTYGADVFWACIESIVVLVGLVLAAAMLLALVIRSHR